MCTLPDIEITNDFVDDQAALFRQLVAEMPWAECTRGLKTAVFGVPFADGAPSSTVAPLPSALQVVADAVAQRVGWQPNRCRLNYYPQRRSALGMHEDPTEGLEAGTGVAIVSVGATRVMVFERDDGSDVFGRELRPGSLMVIGLASSVGWRHGVPARPGVGPRIGLIFRRVAAEPAAATG